ncbi:EAP30,Vacuolar protein sorting protein 36, GLUE domain,Winged helix-turn-helix DNA-binding domain,PH [Cinara cedri]|uniref:Vacuolar protein-sorting-associated protein 36 n=1 Tax=Cinara cedri TaxID=506608 RepID=A0A5E4NMN5_9HEMI|nr:EAP30,Vacuolar protein sorting protein 36, GLUE domain,Winged helix-turn-helix DNA-binding domain,PH [Cinara cedri]
MDRFEYAKLDPAETVICGHKNVTLYDGDYKTSFHRGNIILTATRFFWTLGEAWLSLQLRYIVYIECTVTDTLFGSKIKTIVIHLLPSDNTNPGPVACVTGNYIKLDFKDKVPEGFFDVFQKTIGEKKWLIGKIPHHIRTGIGGIEKNIYEKQKASDVSITDAFKDLDRLMITAKDMVMISKNISEKIKEKQGAISDDETVRFKSYLLGLGVDDPVTRSSFTDSNSYYTTLCKEIIKIIQVSLDEVGGTMALAEVYCRVNRARGLDLLSPEDLMHACFMMNSDTSSPIKLKQFDSGVLALQSSMCEESVVLKKIVEALKISGSLSAQELSTSIGVSVLLAKEYLLTAEKNGKSCRDESIEGLKFYLNKFLEEN